MPENNLLMLFICIPLSNQLTLTKTWNLDSTNEIKCTTGMKLRVANHIQQLNIDGKLNSYLDNVYLHFQT